MKKLKYNIRAAIIRFLLKCCKALKGNCYCTNEFYYGEDTLKVGDIKNTFAPNKYAKIPIEDIMDKNIHPPWKEVMSWRELMEDIKTNGIKTKPMIIKNRYGYEIVDGNHRLKILEYLYGKDYEVLVDLYIPHKTHIPYYATMGIAEELYYLELKVKQIIKTRKSQMKNKTYEA